MICVAVRIQAGASWTRILGGTMVDCNEQQLIERAPCQPSAG